MLTSLLLLIFQPNGTTKDGQFCTFRLVYLVEIIIVNRVPIDNMDSLYSFKLRLRDVLFPLATDLMII